MDREKTLEALEQISDRHIEEAARPPKKTRAAWISAVAAILAVAICIGIFLGPARITVKAVALPGESRLMPCPLYKDFENWNDYKEVYDRYAAQAKERVPYRTEAVSGLQQFFVDGNREFLSDGTENRLWSPVNAYIGLAMVAELAEGESRQQILDLFEAENIEELRQQVSAVWETTCGEGCTLANSLWLENGLRYKQETVENLAYHYYASVYQGNLGSDAVKQAIGDWLNESLQGIFGDVPAIELTEETLMALYSTICFQSLWYSRFWEKDNTQGIFHGTNGEKQVTFMNSKPKQLDYYWGDTFGAVEMQLGKGTMWFILPDEGLTTADVLADGQYMQMISGAEWENKKYMRVNLSVPKFDISAKLDLQDGLKNLGVTDVFSAQDADFSGITSRSPLYLGGVDQSIRVMIDEEGVKAGAYVEEPLYGAMVPPDEIIDFILDRPFLFVIERNGLLLFAGCVNDP